MAAAFAFSEALAWPYSRASADTVTARAAGPVLPSLVWRCRTCLGFTVSDIASSVNSTPCRARNERTSVVSARVRPRGELLHQAANDPIRLAKRQVAVRNKDVCQIGGRREALPAARLGLCAVEAQRRHLRVQDLHRGKRGVDGPPDRRLVLLEIAGITHRDRLHDRQQLNERTERGPAAHRASSATTGFFFCGIIELPVAN